jgi:DeoR/GlpR family transcriptional regulator of sugar metabolism
VVVTGGDLHGDELVMTGSIAEATLQRFYVDVCVLGAAGVDATIGITELNHEVAAIHRLMIERAQQVMVLADHSKLGFRAPAVVGPAKAVNLLITDEGATQETIEPLKAAGVEVLCAN